MEQQLKKYNMKSNKPKTEVTVIGNNAPNLDIIWLETTQLN